MKEIFFDTLEDLLRAFGIGLMFFLIGAALALIVDKIKDAGEQPFHQTYGQECNN